MNDRPYVTTRNVINGVSIVIESADPFAIRRSDGSYYQAAEISVEAAKNLIEDIQRRIDWAES